MKVFKGISYWIALLIAISAQAQEPVQYVLSAFAGPAVVATRGMEYNSGFGLKGGATFNKVYVGAMVGAHFGEKFEYIWPGIFAFGIPSGTQHYQSKPLFLEADAGYNFNFKLGNTPTTFLPYISCGLLRMRVESNGIYGETNISKTKLTKGFGLSYMVWISDRVSTGIDYRMYPLGDETFSFGDLAENTIPHGFSTSLIFGALYGMVCYKF